MSQIDPSSISPSQQVTPSTVAQEGGVSKADVNIYDLCQSVMNDAAQPPEHIQDTGQIKAQLPPPEFGPPPPPPTETPADEPKTLKAARDLRQYAEILPEPEVLTPTTAKPSPEQREQIGKFKELKKEINEILEKLKKNPGDQSKRKELKKKFTEMPEIPAKS